MNRSFGAPARTLVTVDLRSWQSLAYAAVAIALGSLLVALSAQIEMELRFSPVPITGQTFAVLLIGASFGSRLGAITMLAYLGEGMAGLPVFAGGSHGLAVMSGPTAGYLYGFVFAAFIVGYLAEYGWDKNPYTTALAMVIGNVVIYALGVLQLQDFVGWGKVWEFGVRDNGIFRLAPDAVLV